MTWRMSRHRCRSSRKAMCCGHANPARMRSPCSAAASSTSPGGTVYVRTVLIPARAINAKSRRSCGGSGNWCPSWRGAKVPYATPRIRNGSLPIAQKLSVRSDRVAVITVRIPHPASVAPWSRRDRVPRVVYALVFPCSLAYQAFLPLEQVTGHVPWAGNGDKCRSM